MLFLLAAVAVVAITFTILSTIGEEKKPLPSEGYGEEKKSQGRSNNQSRTMSMQSIPVHKKTTSAQKESPIVVAGSRNVRDKNKKMNSVRR